MASWTRRSIITVITIVLFAVALGATPANAGALTPSRLGTGKILAPENSIFSPIGWFDLRMQGDGNLVLYAPGHNPIWESDTEGHSGASLVQQETGALDVVAPDGAILWTSGTSAPNAVTFVSDDGHFGVYDVSEKTLWASGPDRSFDTSGCTVENGGKANLGRAPKLYREQQKQICQQAVRFNISPTLIAITLQHEGRNRARFSSNDAGKNTEYNAWALGENSSVGNGQMHPDLAGWLSWNYDNLEISDGEAARRLIWDASFATHMTAAYLSDLKVPNKLSDRETFITYAFGQDQLDELRRTGFSGPQASGRGKTYDDLFSEISKYPGYGADSVVPPS
jgi:hypothetical protein